MKNKHLHVTNYRSVAFSLVLSSCFVCGFTGGDLLYVASAASMQQQKLLAIKGRVVDNNNEPLPGVTIQVKGTKQATVTNAQGEYVLESVNSDAVLVVSFIGMSSQEIAVNHRTSIDVQLSDDSKQLGEVVVTGYQEIKRERMTGSTSVIKAEDLKGLSFTSVDQVLKGRVAGISAMTSGRPGEDASIRVRGANSLTGNMEPIWIIDGMPMQGEPPMVSSSGSLEAMLYQTGIGNIAPDNIESITVLKDAAATAIYGARAANGVIVVTTKRGKEGTTRSNVRAQFTLTERPRSNVRMMNSAEKIRFEREVYNDYEDPYAGRVADLLDRVKRGAISGKEAEEQMQYLSGINTDWFQSMYRPALSMQVNASIMGGSKQTQHYTSMNYLDQKGTELNNNFRRFTLSTKLNHTFNSRLNLETNLTGVYRAGKQTASVINPLRYALYANPYETPNGYDLSWSMDNSRVQEGKAWKTLNAIRDMKDNTSFSRYLEASANMKLEWLTPVEGLKATLQGTISAVSSNTRTEIAENSFTSFKTNWLGDWAYAALHPKFARGSLSESNYTSNSYTLRALLSYNKSWNDRHFLEVMAGTEGTQRLMYSSGVYFPTYDRVHRVVGYPELIEGTDIKHIPFAQLGSTGKYESRLLSYFLTGTYTYDNRYVVSGSIRYDGSDIIGNENQFSPLWNMSGRWNVHQEKFFPKNDFIDILSLRVGYGYTGSIDKNALPFVILHYTENRLYDDMPIPQSFTYANPSIKWQTKRDFNVGFDATLFKHRLNVGVNYYNNKVFDLLDQRNRPLSSGVESIVQNVANLVNRGWEIDVRGDIIRTSKFTWNLGANVAINTNKVTKTYYTGTDQLPKDFRGTQLTFVEGYSAGAWFGYRFAGIDPKNGHVLVYQKDGTTFDMDQLQNATLGLSVPEPSFLGHRNPPVTGGMTTSLRYGQWMLNSGFEFFAGHHILSFNQYRRIDSNNRYITDQERWRTAGDISRRAPIGSPNRSAYYYRYDTNLEKGDYLRCGYVSLNYDVPTSYLKRMRLQSMTFTLTANNLFTLTNYKGIDPALMGSISYPHSRSYILSLNLGI